MYTLNRMGYTKGLKVKDNAVHRLDVLSPDLIDQLPIMVVGFDRKGRILYWNEVAESIIGYTKEEAIMDGAPLFLRIFLHEDGKDKDFTEFSDAAQPFSETSFNKTDLKCRMSSILTKSGNIRYIRWSSYRVKGRRSASSDAVIVVGVDETACYTLQDRLEVKQKYIKTTTNRLKKYLSLDPHTGLLNYRHFIHRLNNVFHRFTKEGRPFSLLVMDIDYFCSVNNTYGASRGNQILRDVATLVKNNINKEFTAARFSGTEFAVLMPGIRVEAALDISGRLGTLINSHNFGFQSSDVNIALSLHMALCGRPYCGDIYTPEQLLNSVSDKLREAKRMGFSSMVVCPPRMAMQQVAGQKNRISVSDNEYKYTVEFVRALANTVRTKDFYTQQHSSVMSNFATRMAEHVGMSSVDVQNVRFGSILHDIGKIGIDKRILLKPRSLTTEEFRAIRQHPRIGAEIIRSVHPLRDVVPLVLYHHERFDGKGYLDGLKGKEIPLGARIISLADVFQALTSDRPYRKAFSEKNALSLIREYSGSYFDPKIVEAFFGVYNDIKWQAVKTV